MENLIYDFIRRLEHIKDEEKIRIRQCQNICDKDSAGILMGKIMAIDYCISELRRMVVYEHQSEKIS